ncbi:Ferrichrome-iron receptor [Candidatus Nitrotoga arctica]|uniref:Ferrichrome-iron receptor n=2 Tax=Candidatus Nitrotoga arctica TaxID=453162 RepID=A0ABN8AQ35_9PROT|nr:Ferrichrome-iron receptor [Candidatus Nitrotoga arctica]
MNSYALADTLSMLDERILLTLGVRYQEIQVTAYNWATGAFESDYLKSKTTAAVGLVFKVTNAVSLYSNYVEALSQGTVALSTAVNPNEVFAPIVTKQGEAGVKIDWGKLYTSLSAFQISKPSGFLNASNRYLVAGEQRIAGWNFSLPVRLHPVYGYWAA